MTYTVEYLRSLSDVALVDHWVTGQYPFDWLRDQCGCLVMHQHGICLFHEALTHATKKLPRLYVSKSNEIHVSALRENIEKIIRLREKFDRLYPKGPAE